MNYAYAFIYRKSLNFNFNFTEAHELCICNTFCNLSNTEVSNKESNTEFLPEGEFIFLRLMMTLNLHIGSFIKIKININNLISNELCS